MEKKDENTSNIDTKPKKSAKEQLNDLIISYLASNPMSRNDGKVNEVEIRFGSNTRKYKPITKIDYDNVVKNLFAAGFKIENPDGFHSLRISHEYINEKTGNYKMSNIRAEVNGVDMIQEYCNTNSLQKILDMPSTTYDKLQFTEKTRPKNEAGEFINAADFEDFNLRVHYKLEQTYTARTNFISRIIQKWADSKKTFRHMNRVRFYHDDLPIFADLSIVRSSKTSNKVPMTFYTIQEAGVFNGIETYEIEMEIDNSKIGVGTNYNNVNSIVDMIRKVIRIVLGGLQRTNYPISYKEKEVIQHEYMRLLHGEEYQPSRILPRDFIGPSSYTLQIENIMEENEYSNVPNIRKNYTVTDKADGERSLLYISNEGKIYMIDTNMNVVFTGSQTKDKTLFDSLLDGEHIRHDKFDKPINLYAAFDIYYINKKSTREYAFCCPIIESTESSNVEKKEDAKKEKPKFRISLLTQFIKFLKPVSILENSEKCQFHIKYKTFYSVSNENTTIFECCSHILSGINDGVYEYNTDGLIFTPSNTGVASNSVGVAGPRSKTTWEESFKWKPAHFNTIDFLVSVKKDKTGKDEVRNIFQDGKNLERNKSVLQYKTLVLRCGYDERKHGYLNPFDDIIKNKLPSPDNLDAEDGYKPVPFQPTNPYDSKACFANIMLEENGNRELLMLTKEGEYFEEDMIVEFSYDITKSEGWRWVPLRVRYDKTTELRNGLKNYGNAYHVANSNWQSIHQPITDDMITKGINIPSYIEICNEEENGEANEGIYYSSEGQRQKRTQSLRDFHNLYVKNKLITGVAERKNTLIDYAVGKGGDLPKWIYSNLSFVFGIDISRDNIHNNIDGACARYLNYRKTKKNMPYALFVNGNSGNNIRDGTAFITEKDKEIARAVFGTGPKDLNLLGQGVYNQYGVGHDGFNISSCQFALHYFFETNASINRFLKNIAECTKLNGYFIGTCFDGKTVFNLLRQKHEGESITIMDGEKKMFELTKMYSQTGFPDDDTGVGYPINVYQETIGKTFREYLVNFDYLIRLMEDYGFVLLTKEESVSIGLPNGSGLFDELFKSMEIEIKTNPKRNADYKNAGLMTSEEKQISFMNRYFVFRKARNVNTDKIYKSIVEESIVDKYREKSEEEEEKEKEPPIEKKEDGSGSGTTSSTIKTIKKNKVKITINEEKTEPEIIKIKVKKQK
jgi:hypothetical protein